MIGKSLFITGSGVLHWYHGGPLTYRAMAVMGIITGCMGRNGGGFNHYVGTEKIRPYAAIGTLGGAADWTGPPRHQNSTSYFYFHTDQWRYDGMVLDPLWAPWAEKFPAKGNHAADQNAMAVRLGWLPFYPQVDKKNPIEFLKEARASGADTEKEVGDFVAKKFKDGSERFALEDVDADANHPKVLWIWRGNLIGTSMRGHEYGLKHLLGTHNNVLGEDRANGLVKEVEWHDQAPLGKLDLVVNVNLRMDSSANYADIVLPTAHWYEKYDLTCSDLHSFFHPFTPAHDPPWEAKDDWEAFKACAAKVSELAKKHLPDPFDDMVMTPMITDCPDEMAQPMGELRDWKTGDVDVIFRFPWRDQAPLGKLDLVVNVNLRMDSSANYADIVLPTAHWYEKYDLTCSDLHSFFHPFTPAHDPPWEAKDDWEAFKACAAKVSELAKKHLPDPFDDMVMTPMITDCPDEMAQPMGELRDWKTGDVDVIPGKTFPNVKIVERDYTKILDKYTTFGPNVCKPEGYGCKGIKGDLTEVYEQLKGSYLVGEKDGRPSLESAQQVCEVILRISPESDGEVSHMIFKNLEKRCGVPLAHLVEGDREIHHHYPELQSQPRRSLTSPHWSAIESPG